MAKLEVENDLITIVATTASLLGGGYIWVLKTKKTQHDYYKEITEDTITRLESEVDRLKQDKEELRKELDKYKK